MFFLTLHPKVELGKKLHKVKNMAEFDEQLICAVKEGPCLYNVRSSDFKVTWKEENAWVAISNKLNRSSTG